MAISVTTSNQYNLSVVLNDGNAVNLTALATSVAVSQPSPLNVTVRPDFASFATTVAVSHSPSVNVTVSPKTEFVSVSQASPINVTVSSKGPKGDPGTGGTGGAGVSSVNDFDGDITIAPADGYDNVSVTDNDDGTIYIGVDDFSYTNATEMPDAVGGWPSGSTFNATSLQEMFDGLLYPYQEPSFSRFTVNTDTIQEVGSSIPANRTYTFAASNESNINPGSVDITYYGIATGTIATGLNIDDSPYAATHDAIANSTIGNLTFKVEATNSQNSLFSRTYTVSYRWRAYWGNSASESLNEAGIEGLGSSSLKTSENGTYDFDTAENQYKYLCWPDGDGFGSPAAVTGFKDAATNNVIVMATAADDAFFSETENGWSYGVVSVTNSNGVETDYRVYRSKNKLGSALDIEVN